MVALSKVVIIAMLLMFVDAIIQHITGGGILLQGDRYSFIDLILLFFQLIVTFIGIIVHAITHWESIPADLLLIVNGFIVLIFFITRSVLDIFWHLFTFPFLLLGAFADSANIGLGIKLDLGVLGGFLIDFRTLTFQLAIGDVENVEILGIFFTIRNKISISLLGNADYSSMRFIGGSYHSWYLSNQGAFSLGLDIKDGAETCFPDVPALFVCIPNNLTRLHKCAGLCNWAGFFLEGNPTISFWNELNNLFDDLPIPKLIDWIDEAWATLGITVSPSGSSAILQYIKYNIDKVVNLCLKRKVMGYHYPILNMA